MREDRRHSRKQPDKGTTEPARTERDPVHQRVDNMFRSEAKEAISATGKTALQLLAEHPDISTIELAEQLSGRVGALGIEMLILEEAEEQGIVRDIAKELLIRSIRENLPHGWIDDGRVHPLCKISMWEMIVVNYTKVSNREYYTERILCDLGIENPPRDGWKPEWPNDPRIDELFDKYWPVKPLQ